MMKLLNPILVLPISFNLATFGVIIRLLLTGQASYFGYSNTPYYEASIFSFLFGSAGTLETAVCLQSMFSAGVLWLILFGISWLVLTYLSTKTAVGETAEQPKPPLT